LALNSKKLAFVFLILFTVGMVAVYYAGQPVPPQRIALDVSKNLEHELQRLDEQAALILSNLEDGKRWTPPMSRAYSFFLFGSSRLIEWSSNDFVPTAASVAETFSLKLLKAGNGNYLAKKWKLKDARREICRWQDILQHVESIFEKEPGYRPTPANPLVFHLHGALDVSESLVLTEDDYLTFLANMAAKPNLLPEVVQQAFAATSFLFIAIVWATGIFASSFRLCARGNNSAASSC